MDIPQSLIDTIKKRGSVPPFNALLPILKTQQNPSDVLIFHPPRYEEFLKACVERFPYAEMDVIGAISGGATPKVVFCDKKESEPGGYRIQTTTKKMPGASFLDLESNWHRMFEHESKLTMFHLLPTVLAQLEVYTHRASALYKVDRSYLSNFLHHLRKHTDEESKLALDKVAPLFHQYHDFLQQTFEMMRDEYIKVENEWVGSEFVTDIKRDRAQYTLHVTLANGCVFVFHMTTAHCVFPDKKAATLSIYPRTIVDLVIAANSEFEDKVVYNELRCHEDDFDLDDKYDEYKNVNYADTWAVFEPHISGGKVYIRKFNHTESRNKFWPRLVPDAAPPLQRSEWREWFAKKRLSYFLQPPFNRETDPEEIARREISARDKKIDEAREPFEEHVEKQLEQQNAVFKANAIEYKKHRQQIRDGTIQPSSIHKNYQWEPYDWGPGGFVKPREHRRPGDEFRNDDGDDDDDDDILIEQKMDESDVLDAE